MMRAAGAFLAVLIAAHILSAPTLCQNLTVEEASAPQLLAAVRSGGASVTVVNFWATWCIPCREEFPAYLRAGREFENDRVHVLFVSLDFPEDAPEAGQFLAEQGVTGRTYLKSGNVASFVKTLHPAWTGALPATALLDTNGTLIAFWEGRTSYDLLKERINRALDTASESKRIKEDTHR